MIIKTKEERLAALMTVLVHCVMFILFMFFGLSVPLPLPAEEGVEIVMEGTSVNLGNSETGSGDIQPNELSNPGESKNTENIVSPQSNPSSTESLAESDETESVNLNAKKVEQNVKTEPVINQNAMFRKSNNSQTSGGSNQGIKGGIGDQGKPGGDPNSNNYIGNPGPGGDGIKVGGGLKGRTKQLVKPTEDNTEEGIVVVEVSIDERGNIINVRGGVLGSTTNSRNLIRKSEEAAKKSTYFSSDKSVKGTITYTYIRH